MEENIKAFRKRIDDLKTEFEQEKLDLTHEYFNNVLALTSIIDELHRQQKAQLSINTLLGSSVGDMTLALAAASSIYRTSQKQQMDTIKNSVSKLYYETRKAGSPRAESNEVPEAQKAQQATDSAADPYWIAPREEGN